MTNKTSSLLIDESPLQVLPSLAVKIGLNEAIVLQQIHYLCKHAGILHNVRLWIKKSAEDWQSQDFPFWSISTVKRILVSLKPFLLTTIEWNETPFDKTLWYTIDYDSLNREDQVDTVREDQNDTIRQDQNDPLLYIDSKDKEESSGKSDVPKKRVQPIHHCVYLATAKGSFGLEHDQINGTGKTIGAIVYGSKQNNQAGFLQIHFKNFTPVKDWEGYTQDQFEALSIELQAAYQDWEKKGISAPRDPVKIEAMLHDYLKSHPATIPRSAGFAHDDIIFYTVRDGKTIPFTIRNGLAYGADGKVIPPDIKPLPKSIIPGVDDDDEPQF